ncbi:NPC intracellular cholesterol transporter 2 homolog a-like [Athalia rosae]|uniref:NPC intracellular cholesterol transporter 2 homolog a-like n=1 Tax=Athalia rosae TaxID=37344 RepID=UPI002033F278|nr:NPC intracellular cholesterol transporter 2 homolog a-like [Athalia rosae]
MFSIIVLALLSLSSLSNGFRISNCGSPAGSYSRILISGCDDLNNVCVLHRGTNVSMEIDFQTTENVVDVKTVVHGTILVVPIRFPVPHPDACTDPNSGLSCPLNKEGQYHYKSTFPVHTKYPAVSLTVKWELQDENGNDIVCFELPAKIR